MPESQTVKYQPVLQDISDAVVDSLLSGIIILAKDGIILKANKKARVLFENDLVGKEFVHLPVFSTESQIILRNTLQAVIGENKALSAFNVTEGDCLSRLIVNYTPLQTAEETVSAVLLEVFTRLDHRIPHPCSDEKTLFESFMEYSPTPAWMSDHEGRLIYMNKKYRQTFNLSDKDLNLVPSIFPPEYLALYIQNNLKVIRENTSIEVIEDGNDQHGNYLICKVFKFPVHTIEKAPLVGGWMVDLTSMIQLENELKRSNERYKHASEATSDVIWEWDLKNNRLYIGNGYRKIFGYKPPVTIDQLFDKLISGDKERVRKSLADSIDQKRNRWIEEYKTEALNKSIKIVVNKAVIVREESGKAIKIIGALQDVTQSRTLQAKMLQAQIDQKKDLLHAIINTQEKERSILSSELHDNVNQILASCKLMTEVLKEEIAHPFIAKTYEQIQKAIDEIRTITHALTPPGLGINLNNSIQELLSPLNSSGKVKAVFEFTGDRKEMETMDAEYQITIIRIVQEQINNILKHSEATLVQIYLIIDHSTIRLVIKDNGKGTDESSFKKGLGLQNIFNRIDFYNGNAEIETQKGKGFKLMIVLPINKS
jgi:PAS domain S-box-containing protein